MRQYRHKPTVISAIQLGHVTIDEFNAFMEDHDQSFTYKDGMVMDAVINTPSGRVYSVDGDYVIKGVAGEYYPCKRDIFEKTYEEET